MNYFDEDQSNMNVCMYNKCLIFKSSFIIIPINIYTEIFLFPYKLDYAQFV